MKRHLNSSLKSPEWLQQQIDRIPDFPFHWKVEMYDEVDSTMDVAADRCVNSGDDALLVLACSQRSGRGRDGRVWESAPGALLATVVVPWEKGIEDLVGGSLVVGLAIAEALEALLGVAPAEVLQLKWPNDILSLSGEKFGGILIQNRVISGRSRVLIGFGLNVLQTPTIIPNVTCLRTLCSLRGVEVPGFDALVLEIVFRLATSWAKFEQAGFQEAFRQKWILRAAGCGKAIEIDTGERLVSGLLIGIGDSGALLVRTAEGVQEVYSGHVVSGRKVADGE